MDGTNLEKMKILDLNSSIRIKYLIFEEFFFWRWTKPSWPVLYHVKGEFAILNTDDGPLSFFAFYILRNTYF